MPSEAEYLRKKIWRENIPSSIPSCMRFKKLFDAKDHAKETSQNKTEIRHVIQAGDYYFSSTTAQIFWYERLIISFRNGLVEKNQSNYIFIDPE